MFVVGVDIFKCDSFVSRLLATGCQTIESCKPIFHFRILIKEYFIVLHTTWYIMYPPHGISHPRGVVMDLISEWSKGHGLSSRIVAFSKLEILSRVWWLDSCAAKVIYGPYQSIGLDMLVEILFNVVLLAWFFRLVNRLKSVFPAERYCIYPSSTKTQSTNSQALSPPPIIPWSLLISLKSPRFLINTCDHEDNRHQQELRDSFPPSWLVLWVNQPTSP